MAAFFYGTLMSPEVRTRVLCPQSATPERKLAKMARLRIRPAILKNHQRRALKGLDYPGVIHTGQISDEVHGVLCQGLSEEDMARLDAFEGDEYERRTVEVIVSSADGPETVTCQVYIWIEGHHYLEDHDWTLDGFINGKQSIWLQDRCEFKMVDELDASLA